MEYDFYVYLCALDKIFPGKSVKGRAVLEKFPDLSQFFALGEPLLKKFLGNDNDLISRIMSPVTLENARREVDWAASNGIGILPVNSTCYPKRLAECPDAPLILYCRGKADLNPERALAVVGTRKATYYGKESCRNILSKMAQNEIKPTIISGLALGIDGVAHNAALELGLPTVAVIPTGIDDIYPPAHRELASRIVRNGGALVTDFPRNTTPARFTFLRRNRIIAGMSDAVLLAESFVPGGGLITASLASSYSREVFAVPGRMGDNSFEGCNKLIEENIASIVRNTSSIEKAMGWASVHSDRKQPLIFDESDSKESKTILGLLKERSPLTVEELVSGTGIGIRAMSSTLISLEVKGRIRRDRQFYYICT